MTLAGLIGLALWLARKRPGRAVLLALAPVLLLIWGLLGTRPAPAAQPVQAPATPLATSGLTLLGTRTQVDQDGFLMVYPTWLVNAAPAELRMAWTLLDEDGNPYPLATSRPFFNTLETAAWSPATVVDDAYRLALPTELTAGEYALQLSLRGPGAEAEPVIVATLELGDTPQAASDPALLLDWQFGDHASLAGVSLAQNDRPVPLDGSSPPTVKPGDRLAYELRWLGDGAIEENYHAFLHLLDHTEAPLLQGDQLPGPVFSPPRLWNPYRAAPDTYWFTVPDDAPSGLYRGAVGLYRFAEGERLPVTSAEGASLGDRGLLPPIKIVNPPEGRPETRVDARFAGIGTLAGYTLMPAEAAVRPGETVTVTLYYEADGPAAAEFTQFVHLYSGELGMAAQRDAQPGDGGNPTSVWKPGEKIVEEVMLTIAPDAQPGVYELLVGFYDAQAGAVRVPVADRDGTAYVNDQIPVAVIEISP